MRRRLASLASTMLDTALVVLALAPAGAQARPTCHGKKATVVLGGGNNKYVAPNQGHGNQVVVASAGDDYIVTGKGSDVICAGDGNDRILAGRGSDHVYGGTGDDTIIDIKGKDSSFGEDGNDSLQGGPSADAMDGGTGNDSCDVTAGDKTTACGLGALPETPSDTRPSGAYVYMDPRGPDPGLYVLGGQGGTNDDLLVRAANGAFTVTSRIGATIASLPGPIDTCAVLRGLVQCPNPPPRSASSRFGATAATTTSAWRATTRRP